MYPEDAKEGVWRLDVGINEVQLASQLHCIKQFAQNTTSPLYSLIVKSTGRSSDASFVNPRIAVCDDDLRAMPACALLNAQPWLAVKMSLYNRVLLIQGPPGTGKTTTAAALVSVHAQKFDKILVVKISVRGRKSN